MIILGWYPCQNSILLLHDRCPNQCYLSYLRPFFSNVISDKSLKKSLKPLSSRIEVRHYLPFSDRRMLAFTVDWASKIQKQWNKEKRLPLLTLTESDYKRGLSCLNKMGIPSDAWFVSLHVRDIREGGINTRNADIMTINSQLKVFAKGAVV